MGVFFAWSNLGTHCFLHWYRKYYTYTYSETTFTAYVHDFIHLFDMEKIRWWLCFYYHYWPWNKSGEEVEYKILEKERKTRDAPRSKPQKKEESVFEEVGADTKNSKRRAWEGRVWSQKCWKVRGYCRVDSYVYFLWNAIKTCIYAVNGFSPYVSVPYFLYQCRKGCVPKLDQAKKNDRLSIPKGVSKLPVSSGDFGHNILSPRQLWP